MHYSFYRNLIIMSRNKLHAPEKYGRANIAGMNIKRIRMSNFPELSQNGLASQVQLEGIPMTKNAVQRMEAGLGAINDIQLLAFAKVLKVDVKELLDESIYQNPPVNYDEEKGPFGNLEVAVKKQDYK